MLGDATATADSGSGSGPGSGAGSPIVDLGRRPRDTRRLLALAAALLVVVGLAAVAIVGAGGDDRPREQAEAPALAARFPVFGHLPAELEDAHVEADEGEGSHHTDLGSTFDPEAAVARTAVGRVAADGTITDTIQLAAAAEGLADGITPPSDAEVEDLGGGYQLMALVQEVWLYGPDRSVTAVSSTEGDAEAVVRALVDDLRATRDPVAVLRAVEPPAGLTVIAPPSLREAEKAEISVPNAPPCDAPSRAECDLRTPTVVVETGAGQPELAVMSVGGDELADGRVLVVGFGPDPACDGCSRVNSAVVSPNQAGWEPTASVWASDDGPDPQQVILAHGPDDLLGVRELDAEDTAAWAINELPTTVVVGPDGIVRAVLVGGTTVEAIDAAVEAVLAEG